MKKLKQKLYEWKSPLRKWVLSLTGMEMVVLPNSSMWYHILNYGMDTKSNRNDNVTLEVMDGKETTVAYLPKGCRKVRVEVFPLPCR